MDEHLTQIGGKRLTKLMRPDLPQLAQAIVDAERGLNRVGTGTLKGRRFINLRRKGGYDVYVRGEDWDKIFPFLRNSASTFEPAPLPVVEPSPIPASQPNRLTEAVRESPSGGRSFIQGRMDYDTQREVTDLLTTITIGKSEANLPSRTLGDQTPGPQINPPVPPQINSDVRTASALDMREEQARRRILDLLLQLFPEDFPTSAL